MELDAADSATFQLSKLWAVSSCELLSRRRKLLRYRQITTPENRGQDFPHIQLIDRFLNIAVCISNAVRSLLPSEAPNLMRI